MPVRIVCFDWGGTLGKSGHRSRFLDATLPMAHRCASLDDATVSLLKWLKQKDIAVAIVSNTKVPRAKMERALRETGLLHYIDFQVYSSDPGMCRKPCNAIYREALLWATGMLGRRPQAHEIVFVGDQWSKDVTGPSNAGMSSVWLSPKCAHRTIGHNRDNHTFVTDHLNGVRAIIERDLPARSMQ